MRSRASRIENPNHARATGQQSAYLTRRRFCVVALCAQNRALSGDLLSDRLHYSVSSKHILSLDDFAGLESEIGSSQPIVNRRSFGMCVLSISLDNRKIPPAHGEIRMTQDILKRENIPAIANVFNGKSVAESMSMNPRDSRALSKPGKQPG